MFHFCIADSEHDWREGSEQYAFIEHCLASVDRKKQPWLIFASHRVLGYSSDYWYGQEGSFEEPMGRESLQKLWQKYKVDIAFYGHVHNYERSCPIYQVRIMEICFSARCVPFTFSIQNVLLAIQFTRLDLLIKCFCFKIHLSFLEFFCIPTLAVYSQ